MLLADVLAQDVGEGSISARMRMLLAQDAVRRGAFRVVADRDPGLLERQHDIRLRHHENRDRGEGLVLDEQIEDRVDGIFVP